MTVNCHDHQTVMLEGTCGVEDAEVLLQMLVAMPAPTVDWRSCRSVHTAVFQVIFNARPRLTGPCGDAWVEAWLVPGMLSAPANA